jgi:tellurite resistance protein
MGFVENVLNRKVSPQEAAISAGVYLLMLGGDFSDFERQALSLMRDVYPPLSKLRNDVFIQAIERALHMLYSGELPYNAEILVRDYLVPALPCMEDKQGVYSFVYALGKANLNVDDQERDFLEVVGQGFSLNRRMTQTIETAIDTEFDSMYKAIAVIAVGLVVVTADGKVKDDELLDMQKNRGLVPALANLDDTQFEQLFNLTVSMYNRFLSEEANRRAFLYNVLPRVLSRRDLRLQVFHYAASICTSDGDVATSEVTTLQDILVALDLHDDLGASIFNQYMSRVKTIDGHTIVK